MPEDVARFGFEDVRDPADAIDALVERARRGVGPALVQFRFAVLLSAVNRKVSAALAQRDLWRWGSPLR